MLRPNRTVHFPYVSMCLYGLVLVFAVAAVSKQPDVIDHGYHWLVWLRLALLLLGLALILLLRTHPAMVRGVMLISFVAVGILSIFGSLSNVAGGVIGIFALFGALAAVVA